MRHMVLGLGLIVAAAVRAEAQGGNGSGGAAAADPLGIYDFYISMQGQTVGGRLVVRDSAGKYRGTIAPDGMGEPLSFDSVVVAGAEWKAHFTIPGQGMAAVSMTPTQGDSLKGKLTGAAGEMDMTVVRIRQ